MSERDIVEMKSIIVKEEWEYKCRWMILRISVCLLEGKGGVYYGGEDMYLLWIEMGVIG